MAIRAAECFSYVKIHHMLIERETGRTLIMAGLGTVQAGARSTRPGLHMHWQRTELLTFRSICCVINGVYGCRG